MASEFPPGFVWDEEKNRRNVAKHGIDFRDAVRIFENPTLDRIDDRRPYGETRVNSIGVFDDRGVICVNVTHTERDSRIRIISARAASAAERAAYDELVQRPRGHHP